MTSVAPIVRDVDAARSFYRDALGLPSRGKGGDYAFTHELEGSNTSGSWPLSEAALACFGTDLWPADVPIPQASIEFEVDDVAAAGVGTLRRRAIALSTMPRQSPGVRSPLDFWPRGIAECLSTRLISTTRTTD